MVLSTVTSVHPGIPQRDAGSVWQEQSPQCLQVGWGSLQHHGVLNQSILLAKDGGVPTMQPTRLGFENPVLTAKKADWWTAMADEKGVQWHFRGAQQAFDHRLRLKGILFFIVKSVVISPSPNHTHPVLARASRNCLRSIGLRRLDKFGKVPQSLGWEWKGWPRVNSWGMLREIVAPIYMPKWHCIFDGCSSKASHWECHSPAGVVWIIWYLQNNSSNTIVFDKSVLARVATKNRWTGAHANITSRNKYIKDQINLWDIISPLTKTVSVIA